MRRHIRPERLAELLDRGRLRRRRRQVMPAARIRAAGITCRPCQLLP
jgi:hypothetical protein